MVPSHCYYIYTSTDSRDLVTPKNLRFLQGTARRKRKVVHKTATDDKKLQVRSGFCGTIQYIYVVVWHHT